MKQLREQEFKDIIGELGLFKSVRAPETLRQRIGNALVPSLSSKPAASAFFIPSPAIFALLLIVGIFGITGLASATTNARKGDLLYPFKEAIQHTPFAPVNMQSTRVITPLPGPSSPDATPSASQKHEIKTDSHQESSTEKSDKQGLIPAGKEHVIESGESLEGAKGTAATPTPSITKPQDNSKGVEGEIEKSIHSIVHQIVGSQDDTPKSANSHGNTKALKGGD